MGRSIYLGLAIGLALSCSGTPPAHPPLHSPDTTPKVSPQVSPHRTVVLLYTSDEHGWLVPHGTKGGAVAVFSHWLTKEAHCIPSQAEDCKTSSTLAVSGGDNWTGPSISTFYRGVPMAKAMRNMGFASSALGNHEFDFGQEQLKSNAAAQGYPYLAANVELGSSKHPFPVQPMLIVERNGVKLGLVGGTTELTPTIAMPPNMEGFTFNPLEKGLGEAVERAYEAGADGIALIVHACVEEVVPVLEKHPEWNVAFVGTGHCHKLLSMEVGKTKLVQPAAELTHYARIELALDLSRPVRDRVVKVDAELVEVGELPAALPPQAKALEEDLSLLRADLKSKLGESIGYTSRGMPKFSPEMAKWILSAWKGQLAAQVAIINRHAMRQDLAAGPIRVQDVYDILPFENKLIVLQLTGQALEENASCCDGMLEGLKLLNGKWVLEDGSQLEPQKLYSVVVPDFIFFGGDRFQFRKHNPEMKLIGDWRIPLIEWMKAHGSSEKSPIESQPGRN